MSENETLDPKLVARIQKLHAMAEGAREVGSLAEADSFMRAVEKTLAAYNLDMSVVSMNLKDVTDPLGCNSVWGATGRHKYTVPRWALLLGRAVADAHYCEMLNSIQYSVLFFYGRKQNRETAERMYVYLRDMAERLGAKAFAAEERRRIKEYGSKRGASQWRLNWLEGFATEVARRYATMRARLDSDKGMSLVLTSVRKEAEDYAVKFITIDVQTDITKAQYYDEQARALGAKAARSASLRPHTIEDAAPAPTRALTSGGSK